MRQGGDRVCTDDLMNASVTAPKLAAGVLAGAVLDASAQSSLSGLGSVPIWVKFTLSYTAVAALGASLTGSIAPSALVIPAGTVVHDAVMNVTTAFAGCATLKVNIGDNESATDMFDALNLKSAVATGASLVLPYTAADQVNLAFTATTNDLNALTAGSATLYLLCSALD
jgi:hypothetical protein